MINYFLNKIKEIRLDFIDLVVILSYYLFSVLLVLSLFGLFNKYWVGGVLLMVPLFILAFRQRIKFSKYNFLFFIFVPLLFIGFLLFKGFFTGDAITYWLPWAREIVLQGEMPDFLLDVPHFMNGRMPFLPLLFAAVFVFLPFKEIFAVIIPLFFVAATVLLLYQWAKDKEISKQYLIFIVLLFLTNPVTMKYGWDLFQESLIVFFFTAFFYYLEKYQRGNNIFYFLLMLFSFVLAIASKFTGVFLVLPLFLTIIKNKTSRKHFWSYSVFISLPVIFWFIRNYIIYDNPVSPFFNGLFKGQYYELIKATSASYIQHSSFSFDSIFVKLGFILKNFLLAFPFVFLFFYGLWKKKKIIYIFSVIVFLLLIIIFPLSPDSAVRRLYPMLGFFLIYALIGLKYIKSRFLLSLIFFLALVELLETKIYISKSYFISSLEKLLDIFLVFSQFLYEYRLAVVIALSLFFYFFLSNKKYWQYLILLIFCSYLVTTSTIQISWLNIWLPILFLIFVILIWRYLNQLKELFLRRLIISYVVVLLILNSWGLALSFFAAHDQFIFPKMESYGILPEVASQIKDIEGDSKDFYVYVALPGYLTWHHDYKVVSPDSYNLHYITNDLRPNNSLTAQEIHSIFQKSNIKYITKNAYLHFWQDFFDVIKEHPDLFKLIFEKEEYSLWRII